MAVTMKTSKKTVKMRAAKGTGGRFTRKTFDAAMVEAAKCAKAVAVILGARWPHEVALGCVSEDVLIVIQDQLFPNLEHTSGGCHWVESERWPDRFKKDRSRKTKRAAKAVVSDDTRPTWQQ